VSRSTPERPVERRAFAPDLPAAARRQAARSAAAGVRQVRLVSGLVLVAYLATHLLNHALGLVSLDAMEAGRVWFLRLWRNPAGTLAFYGALLTHFGLALGSLYQRRTLRMPAWEASQLLLGLLIPPLLFSHAIGTRLAWEWSGTEDLYARVVRTLWVVRPAAGLRQTALVCVAWAHAGVGLYYWLRLRPWFPRAARPLAALYLAIPLAGLAGFAAAGREVARLSEDPAWVARLQRTVRPPDAAGAAALDRVYDAVLVGYAAVIGIALAARQARRGRARRQVRLTYIDGRQVTVPVGATVLEASRSARIPHASVCGGRGRCSTCRVRVLRGLDTLPPPSADEQRVLERVGAPPGVRLACQLRPARPLTVAPLLPAEISVREGVVRREAEAQEREVVILFADLRAFTLLAERRLPYDVVFLLNRYFAAVGGAVEAAGGIANQFTGDGVMALFGVETPVEEGCRQALAAAGGIVASLGALSRGLDTELEQPLRVGIGIHAGPAVVGRMGYGAALYLTAVGDSVHVAARLQELTKEYGCSLVISEAVALRAGVDVAALPRHELQLRGRVEPLAIRVVEDAARLAAMRPTRPAV
jgi:adenylate cyclase